MCLLDTTSFFYTDFTECKNLLINTNPKLFTRFNNHLQCNSYIMNNPDAEKSVKDYIRKSFGKVAERNGGVNGFYGTLDLRLAKKFKTYKKQNLEVSVDIFNVANMLNKDWGAGHNLGTQKIYSIKGFDKDAKQYTYNVNANTGVSSLNGTPFQVQIGLRYGF